MKIQTHENKTNLYVVDKIDQGKIRKNEMNTGGSVPQSFNCLSTNSTHKV